MPPSHRPQHRPKREVQEIRQSELQQFKAENQRLRREVARLKRELAKYAAYFVDATEEEFEAATDTEPAKIEKTNIGCIVCGSDQIVKVNAGPKTLLVCKSCKWRKTE